MTECFGVDPTGGVCDPVAAAQVVEASCDQLAAATGKADNPFAGFFCSVFGWDCPAPPPRSELSSVRFPGDGTFWMRVTHVPSVEGARLALYIDDVYQRDVERTVVTSDPVRAAAPYDGVYVIRLAEHSADGALLPDGPCLEAEAVIIFDRLSSLSRRDCTR